MNDIFSPEKRSYRMSKIRSKNTAFENIVYGHLKKKKLYFQTHYQKVPGKPDIALPRKKKAVFLNSDFWHGWDYENLKKKLNLYWQKRIERNIARDTEVYIQLNEMGWEILVVWGHDLRRKEIREKTLQKIYSFLTEPHPSPLLPKIPGKLEI